MQDDDLKRWTNKLKWDPPELYSSLLTQPRSFLFDLGIIHVGPIHYHDNSWPLLHMHRYIRFNDGTSTFHVPYTGAICRH